MFNLGFSVSQYQELRLFNLENELAEYPTRNEVVQFKSSLHPPVTAQELKSSVEIQLLYENTLMGLLEVIGVDTTDSDEPLLYEMSAKFGADGSGSHKVRHQKIDRYCNRPVTLLFQTPIHFHSSKNTYHVKLYSLHYHCMFHFHSLISFTQGVSSSGDTSHQP